MSASAENWLGASVDDGRFDRPLRAVVAASSAPSSRRMTASGEALTAGELLAYVSELVDPPTSTPAPMIEPTTAQA